MPWMVRYQKPQPTSYAGSKALTDKEVQRERLEHLPSDRSLLRQKGSTYHQRAVAEAVEERGGRFAALSKPQIVGSGPVMYPVQPPSSPWASDPVGVEPLIDATDCGPKLRRL